MPGSSRPRVVIIGGGFGGLKAARALRKADVQLTLVDRRNHHLFQPLLYQVATAGLTGPDISAPIRQVLRRQQNTTVYLAEVRAIDVAARRLTLDEGTLDYDYLIVAAGADNTYFGNDAWAAHAPGLKSIDDALDVRRRVLLAFEAAEREADPGRRRACLTFVVVGGGPTGVEMAGALAEIGRHTLARDFRNFDTRDTRVVLLEGGPRLLAGMAEPLSEETRLQLQRRGVEVRLGARVETIDAAGVVVGGERIAARTVVWAAGVKPSPLAASLGAPLVRGRVQVAPDLSIPGHPEVFVVGDMIAFEQDGKPLPGMAQVALQSGEAAARNVLRRIAGAATEPFRYRDRGSMATIGRSAAVAEIGTLKLVGFSAWLLWWMVHIISLIEFRDRIKVMIEWAWAYLTWNKAARVIVGRGLVLTPPAPAAEPAPAMPAAAPAPPPAPPPGA